MSSFRALAAVVLLSLSAASLAGPTPVLVQPQASPGSEQTIRVQTSEGASCTTPVVGNCGSCAVSCPSGKAAMCKPGIAVGPQASASCVTPPECKCN